MTISSSGVGSRLVYSVVHAGRMAIGLTGPMMHTLAPRLLGLALVIVATFVALHLLPGDPARIILGPLASQASIEEFRTRAGLDRPVLEQLLLYVLRLADFDLGYSLARRQSVNDLLLERGTVTLTLMTNAAVVTFTVGLLLPALLLGYGRGRALGGLLTISRIIAFAPPYVLAILMLLGLSGGLGLIPILFDTANPGSWIAAAFVLAAYPTGLTMRLFTDELKSGLGSTYALCARAMGAPERQIVWIEVVPNALAPVVTALANAMAYFMTGAFFVEVVFGVPGLGQLAQDALRTRDLVLLSGVCLAFAFVVICLQMIADLVVAMLRPWGRQ